MTKKTYHCLASVLAFILLSLTACHDNPNTMEERENIGTSTRIEGDSTLYGLACDGCTDSVLIFLPGQGGDPVTFDIIKAMKNRRVIGKPTVGSWTAVLVNPMDSTVADLVINLDELKGTWVNMVMPERRNQSVADSIGRADASTQMRARMDSVIQLHMKPVEMGFALKRHYKAETVGLREIFRTNNDPESPIMYPTPKRYSEWHIFNGKLVLTNSPDTIHDQSAKAKNDTAEFILLTPDTLVLRFANGKKGYRRK